MAFVTQAKKEQVWPFLNGLKGQNFLGFLVISIFYLGSWPFIQSIKNDIVKSELWPFLKQRLSFFTWQP